VGTQRLAVSLLDGGQDGTGPGALVDSVRGGDDQLGPPVVGVGLATNVAELDQLVDECGRCSSSGWL
jgi:hypothetical protein